MSRPPVDAVVIGRNEGARLARCLASLAGEVRRLVYVDSGSHDGSADTARAAGAEVIELDRSAPFTAARARHAGARALDGTAHIQFIDGDCTILPGWVEAGRTALDADAELGLVTGWREEAHRAASVYNAMCDVEWHRPAGPIVACGGDMMLRATAYRDAGGFDAGVIAAEDEEFCQRLAQTGWALRRLPVRMTRHDAAMTRFSQWWRRAVRSGHGFAQVGALHPGHFVAERRRVRVFGALLPLLTVAALLTWPWLALAPLAIWARSALRTADGLMRDGLPRGEAWHHSLFLMLSKFPNLIGMGIYRWRRLRGGAMRIIEYK